MTTAQEQPFKASEPTVLNIHWDTFSTHKSRAAALIDGKTSRERATCVVFSESGNAQKHENSPLSGYQVLVCIKQNTFF